MPHIELNSMCRFAITLLLAFSVSLISAASIAAEATKPSDQPTYSKHVAPILWKSCAGCHRTGEVGPFPLLTFKDAEKRADMIADVVARRQMPPWKPEPNFGDFHGVRRLSDDDLKTVVDWAAAGAPEGKSDGPARTAEVHRRLAARRARPDSENAGRVRNTRRGSRHLPLLRAPHRQRRSQNRRRGRVPPRQPPRRAPRRLLPRQHRRSPRKKTRTKPGRATPASADPASSPPAVSAAGRPGYEPQFLPDGLGAYVRPETDFVLQVHYHPSGKAGAATSRRSEFTSRASPSSASSPESRFSNPRLEHSAGAKRHEVRAEATIPVDVTVTGVAPHMHLLGREIKFTATKPDGEVVPLVWIKDWDFNWQDQYRFAETFRLPKGTHLEVVAYYDNSSDNPANPNNPPRRVRWGEETTDEMCLVHAPGLYRHVERRARTAKNAARHHRLGSRRRLAA